MNVSKAAVDRAGRKLLTKQVGEELDQAWDTLTNWRQLHAVPLNTITMDLRQKVQRIEPSAIVAQRLKRARSILNKLSNKSSMRLSQMQDIGGCRAILPHLEDVYKIRNQYKKSRSLHEFVSEDDYIKFPKISGYRGIHLVYRFKSRSRPEFDNLLFEIQLRSMTQHVWATAVETVGAVLGQALKSSEGEAIWLNYFQQAAIALEYIEQPSLVRTEAVSRGSVARELSRLSKQLDVDRKLAAYRVALKATETPRAKGAGYFLLVLLPKGPRLEIYAFDKRNAAEAHQAYERFERQLPIYSPQSSLFPDLADYSGGQVVLVGAESFRSIRDAYPNYHLDMHTFLNKVGSFILRYQRSK